MRIISEYPRRTKISGHPCEIVSQAFFPNVGWGQTTRLCRQTDRRTDRQTDRWNRWTKQKLNRWTDRQMQTHRCTHNLVQLVLTFQPQEKIVALACVLMDPWSSSWSRLRSGGSIWTVEDRSNIFLSIASMATCLRGERREK